MCQMSFPVNNPYGIDPACLKMEASLNSAHHRASFLAASSEHSGDWLFTLHSAHWWFDKCYFSHASCSLLVTFWRCLRIGLWRNVQCQNGNEVSRIIWPAKCRLVYIYIYIVCKLSFHITSRLQPIRIPRHVTVYLRTSCFKLRKIKPAVKLIDNGFSHFTHNRTEGQFKVIRGHVAK